MQVQQQQLQQQHFHRSAQPPAAATTVFNCNSSSWHALLPSINRQSHSSLQQPRHHVQLLICVLCAAALLLQCTNVCASSFAIEEDYGRARVMQQGVDTEDKLQEAIDTCPVSCIHWVRYVQLSCLGVIVLDLVCDAAGR
jgi:ferredoxin